MAELRLYTISFRWLFRLYVIVPAALLIIAADACFFGGQFRALLPRNPENLRILNVLIVWPHIVASSASFIDRDYLKEYKTRLLWGIPIVALLTFGIPFLGQAVAFLAYTIYTVYHVLTQQIGITAMMMKRPPEQSFIIWKWLMIALGVVIYSMLALSHGSPSLATTIAMAVAVVAVTIVGGIAARTSKTATGAKYLWANNAMIAGVTVSFVAGYPFFALLIPRLIHDLSGFFFYVTHDANRNAGQARNLYYGLFAFTGVPIYILSPVLAILVANGLEGGASAWPWINSALLALAYFHYYTEGFMWKRGTAHRGMVPAPAP